MNRIIVGLVLGAWLPAVSLAGTNDTDANTVVSGNTAFALDLYGKLRSQEGNLFLSPYSISTALAMTYGGARGETEKQMAHALHFDLPQDRLHPAFASLEANLNAIQQKGKVKLAVANSLWPQKGYAFLPDYLALCQSHYGTSITPVDYRGDTEGARRTINDWVEQKTNRKIVELLRPGVLDTLTRLVLANAIYFKGTWDSPFQTQFTTDQPFHMSSQNPSDRWWTKTFRHRRAASLMSRFDDALKVCSYRRATHSLPLNRRSRATGASERTICCLGSEQLDLGWGKNAGSVSSVAMNLDGTVSPVSRLVYQKSASDVEWRCSDLSLTRFTCQLNRRLTSGRCRMSLRKTVLQIVQPNC